MSDRENVIAKAGLLLEGKFKAQDTISDICLNSYDLLIYRMASIMDFKDALAVMPTSERQAFMDHVVAPDQEFAGIMGMVTEQLRQAGDL